MKYIVHPGLIDSKNDNDKHYINSLSLIQLHNVNPSECLIHSGKLRRCTNYNEYIHLYPDYNGDYTLFGEKGEWG